MLELFDKGADAIDRGFSSKLRRIQIFEVYLNHINSPSLPVSGSSIVPSKHARFRV